MPEIRPRIAVVVFPGSNDDRDAAWALGAWGIRALIGPWLAYFRPAHGLTPELGALYAANRLRLIADAGYAPVPILPALKSSWRSALNRKPALVRTGQTSTSSRIEASSPIASARVSP